MADTTEATDDLELLAIRQILSALSSLDSEGQTRALQYVFRRLKIVPSVTGNEAPAQSIGHMPQVDAPQFNAIDDRPHTADIRTFTESKQPRSANEMAAVLAYFLQYEAGEDERKDSIGADDINKYFHLAKQAKPANANMTLTHSKNSGYLDQQERGQYKLNAVGYNLVAHKLPAGTSSVSATKTRKSKRSSSKKTPAAKRPVKAKAKAR